MYEHLWSPPHTHQRAQRGVMFVFFVTVRTYRYILTLRFSKGETLYPLPSNTRKSRCTHADYIFTHIYMYVRTYNICIYICIIHTYIYVRAAVVYRMPYNASSEKTRTAARPPRDDTTNNAAFDPLTDHPSPLHQKHTPCITSTSYNPFFC